jgi:hypothetical protein
VNWVANGGLQLLIFVAVNAVAGGLTTVTVLDTVPLQPEKVFVRVTV